MTAPELVALLRRARLASSTEARLQQAIEDALAGAGVAYEREAWLSPGERIDFMVGDVGIEAKTRQPARAIYRQLERYAARDQVGALILVTGTAIGLPASIGGKPTYAVSIGRTAL